MAIIQFSEAAIAGINEAADRRNMLVYMMQNVLTPGGINNGVLYGDYAIIPKCGPKPILLKAGAEKLAQAGRFDVLLQKTEQIVEKDFVMYEVKATIKRDRSVICEHIAIANSEENGIAAAIATQKSTPRAWCHNILCRAEKRAYTGGIVRAWGATGYFTAEQDGMERLDLSEGGEDLTTIEVPPVALADGIKDLIGDLRIATNITTGEIREIAQCHGLPTSSGDLSWAQAKELQRLVLARWVMKAAIGNMAIDVAFQLIDKLPPATPSAQVGLLSFAIEEWEKGRPVAPAPRPTAHGGMSID